MSFNQSTWKIFGAISLLSTFFISSGQIRINEIVASNGTGLQDFESEFPDWIELYNEGTETVNLSNYSLTDDLEVQDKWVLPNVEIQPGAYLIIFASGKDLKTNELHTNFKLSADGEFLGLFDTERNLVQSFDPKYPEIPRDYSYAFFENSYLITSSPSPGEANVLGEEVVLSPPEFSHQSGFYTNDFSLSLSTSIPDATIHYTRNGDDPSLSSSIYSSPIAISTTTIIRAIVIKDGAESYSVTNTYLFLNDVINQPNNPPGFPSQWGNYEAINGTAKGDYEMDPEITEDPKYSGKLIESLQAIPTISLVTKTDNLFSKTYDPETGGIYIFPGAPDREIGKGWEREASIELIDTDGIQQFQENCIIEIHGGHSRRAEKSPKHSFRVSFKSSQGNSKLRFPLFGENATDEFEHFIIKAEFGNSIVHHQHGQRINEQLIRDMWIKNTQIAMGQPGGHGFLAHLYINGVYWGIYNPTERINDDYMESYFGGDKEDYDIIKDYTEVDAGNADAWNRMMRIVRRGLENNANYKELIGLNPDGTNNPDFPTLIDPVNLADYMIINFFVGNQDWDHHNWVSSYKRTDSEQGFRFFCWDSELTLSGSTVNRTSLWNRDCPTEIFHAMIRNEEFKVVFNQRVQLHLTGNGLLTPEQTIERYESLIKSAELAFIAESARWGDYRRDVHNWSAGPYEIYTPEDFASEKSYMLNDYFPVRTANVLEQFENADFLPDLNSPIVRLDGNLYTGGPVNMGQILTIEGLGGDIYYSVDGSDPEDLDLESENLFSYNAPIEIDKSMHLKVQYLLNNQWSGITERLMYINQNRESLKLTEIHYQPLSGDGIPERQFEFIELKNTGSETIDLGGIELYGSTRASLPTGAQIPPGEFAILASNQFAFEIRYGFLPDFQYCGNLDNDGDLIYLRDFNRKELISVNYESSNSWPQKAAGEGYSLIPRMTNPTGNQDGAEFWGHSIEIHGSPGLDDSYIPLLSLESSEGAIYPNPARNFFYLISNSKTAEITITNLSGQLVDKVSVRSQKNVYKVDISKLESGVYLVTIDTGIQKKNARLIIE